MVPLIKHIPGQYRFQTIIDGEEALLQYRLLPGGAWEYLHTFVPQSLRHKGIGEQIAKFALDFARDNNLKIKVSCPFVSQYLESHPEYDDLLVK